LPKFFGIRSFVSRKSEYPAPTSIAFPRQVPKSLEGSRARLRLDQVDIFHLHNAITETGGGEALSVQQRKRDFQAELGEKLADRQKRGLVNQVWGEALALIDNPWLRVTGKKPHRRRPAGDKTG
jgi:hypothetical protein